MTSTLAQLEQLSLSVGAFVEKFVMQNNGFSSRTFYAETYALALLKLNGQLSEKTEDVLLRSYKMKERDGQDFHYEFNNYALLEIDLLCSMKKYQEYYLPLKFKNTKCTNWTLLRNVVKLKSGEDTRSAYGEMKRIINKFQKRSGLILDDYGVKSFQYHCFSTSLIYEAYLITEDDFLKKSFLSAVKFIRNFIMPNGDTLFSGRGQEQSFGYGALIYALVAYYKLTQNPEVLTDLHRVVKFLSSYQRAQGDFPLVLNHVDQGIPDVVNLLDPQFQGWYSYNNFFDYLCFMGFYLRKSHDLLAQLPNPEYLEPRGDFGYQDHDYRKYVTSKYTAIFARPGGYWTNDQTFPLIFFHNKFQTPCVGGEQFVSSLYDEDQLSFPKLLKFKKKSWRKIGRSFWINNTLWWLSPFGVWNKKISISEDRLIIKTSIYSFWKANDMLTLSQKETKLINSKTISSNDLLISCDKDLEYYKNGYSAKGPVEIYKINSSKNTLKIEML